MQTPEIEIEATIEVITALRAVKRSVARLAHHHPERIKAEKALKRGRNKFARQITALECISEPAHFQRRDFQIGLLRLTISEFDDEHPGEH